MNTPKLAIAGGGTGGHIAPALALAEEWDRRFGAGHVHLLCSGNQLERSMLNYAGYSFTTLDVERPRKTLRSKATTVISTAMAVPAARRALRDFGADVLVCVGGYAALPGAMAAGLLRLPVITLEANATPGKVTRTISRFARVCYAHMPLTRSLDCRVEVQGNPIRSAFREPVSKADARRALGLRPDLPTLLVAGGSQGAEAVNAAVLGAIDTFKALGEHFQVLHLTGRSDYVRAESVWRASGLRHNVKPFTHNMATWMSAADVALTRSGAGSISELLALKVPMILVPYPHAADDHQRANALWVAGAGAGVMVPQDALSPERVHELVETFLLSDVTRERASQAAAQLAQPEASRRIVERILAEIEHSPAVKTADQSGRAAGDSRRAA